MTTDQLHDLFKRYEDEYLNFHLIANPTSKRPDLHAFALLDRLVPATGDMVSATSHDEIWLSIELEALAAVVTEDQVLELVRCGVRFDSEGLCMFV